MRILLVLVLLLGGCATPRFIPYWNEAADKKLSGVVESLERLEATIEVDGKGLVATDESRAMGREMLIDLAVAKNAAASGPAKVVDRVKVPQLITLCANSVDRLYKEWAKPERNATLDAKVAEGILPTTIRTCKNALETNRDLK